MIIRSAFFFALAACALPAVAAETCHYTGTASHSGRLAVDTTAATTNGETTVTVTAKVEARYLGLIGFQYLHQEISVWRMGELRQAAVNHRYSVNGAIQRQQWDVFTRGPEGMTAYRAQGKTLAAFQAKHPGFVRYWSPVSFGAPWLEAYNMAAAERRADLDLPRAGLAPGLGTPLAMAFYWIRWANAEGRAVSLFLPGFKRDARVDVPVSLAGVERDGTRHLRVVTRHPQLNGTRPSTGEAWITPDHRLARMVFEAHGGGGSARGEARLERCEGNAGTP